MKRETPDFAPATDVRLRALGASIRFARERAGLTQEQLGTAIGVTRQSVCNVELGKQNVLATQIGALCVALGCSADELLGLRPPQAKDS